MLSLPTPPKCFAASVLATLHAAFARKVRARPSGFSTFEAIWVHLRYGPATRSPSFSDGFVNRLQDVQFPSFLLFKLRGLDSYPGGTFTHCSCQPSLDAHFSLQISGSRDLTTWVSLRFSIGCLIEDSAFHPKSFLATQAEKELTRASRLRIARARHLALIYKELLNPKCK